MGISPIESGQLAARAVGFILEGILTTKYLVINGGLAQLARAFDWQSKGHRFDSGNLHLKAGI